MCLHFRGGSQGPVNQDGTLRYSWVSSYLAGFIWSQRIFSPECIFEVAECSRLPSRCPKGALWKYLFCSLRIQWEKLKYGKYVHNKTCFKLPVISFHLWTRWFVWEDAGEGGKPLLDLWWVFHLRGTRMNVSERLERHLLLSSGRPRSLSTVSLHGHCWMGRSSSFRSRYLYVLQLFVSFTNHYNCLILESSFIYLF